MRRIDRVAVQAAGFSVAARAMVALALAIAAFAATASIAHAGAIIGNGTVQLGIRDNGSLNETGGAASYGGTTMVGLRYLSGNYESTSDGCPCEGWGVADALSGATGFANRGNGDSGLQQVSFTSTATTAVSVVDVLQSGSPVLRVTHDYHPSSESVYLYEVTVTIEAINGYSADDLRYRRVMDWDVQPTPYNEYVTIEVGNSTALLESGTNGGGDSNPLAGDNSGTKQDLVDVGPTDQGAMFDFGFGELAAGATKSFKIYYGAAGTEVAALNALAAVNAEVYTLGQNSASNGHTVGSPATFMFAFAGVGGASPFAPEAVIDSGPAARTSATAATLAFSSATSGASFECSLDSSADGDFSSCSSPVSLTGIAEGAHTFYVRAVSGALTGAADSHSWTVDRTAPGTSFASKPDAIDDAASPQFTFATANDAIGSVSFSCSLDGGTATACASPKSYAGLSEGEHTVAVVGTDDVGNADSTAASYSWYVETGQLPETTITSAMPAAYDSGTSPSVSFGSSEPGSSFDCSVDGAAFAACTSPNALAPLADGTHTFAVRAIDFHGNVDATPSEYGFRVGPEARADAPTAAVQLPSQTAAGRPALQARRSHVDIGCRIDGGSIQSCRIELVEIGASKGATLSAAAGEAPPSLGDVLGTGSTTLSQVGTRDATVRVPLSASMVKKLRSAAAGAGVWVKMTVTRFEGDELNDARSATLTARKSVYAPKLTMFGYRGANLTTAAGAQLARLAKSLGDVKRVICVGHTSNLGVAGANYRLAKRRAGVVCGALRRMGVKAKFDVRSHGPSDPRSTNRSRTGRRSNRRVELTIFR